MTAQSLAYAAALKAPPSPKLRAALERRGTGFGGSSTTNGDVAAGTNNVSASDYGFAAGADYRFTPDTPAGFALAGAGTNWNLAQGLGSGRSDAFQAGSTGRAGLCRRRLAFANHWFSTSRTAPLGDQLSAKFDGQSYGGRLEATAMLLRRCLGSRPMWRCRRSISTPSYSETDLTGGGCALSYNAMDATETRSELGARLDDLVALGAMPLILHGRAAWAHDWVSNPALPGASFIVNGAAPPQDSALASAGAKLWNCAHPVARRQVRGRVRLRRPDLRWHCDAAAYVVRAARNDEERLNCDCCSVPLAHG